MQYVRERTRCKNRLHATFSKYGYEGGEYSDLFGKKGRQKISVLLLDLPVNTAEIAMGMVNHLDHLDRCIAGCEESMQREFGEDPALTRLMSMPGGVGFVLGTVILNEIGDIQRFPSSTQFASYCGTTPRVKASGGKVRYGRLRNDCNHYLKWAFVEAANIICMKQNAWKARHSVTLYRRIKSKRGHQVAIGAVARHLAEAAYWMMKKKEPYKDPALSVVSRQN